MTNMTVNLLTQATTDYLSWNKLATAAENSATSWKSLQKSPNDALIAQAKEHHIMPWLYWQKTNKKD